MLLRAQRLSQPLRRLAGPHVRGLASALSAQARSMGMMVSMAFVTVMLSVRLGADAVADRPDAYMSAMTIAFSVFTVLTGLGVVASLRRY